MYIAYMLIFIKWNNDNGYSWNFENMVDSCSRKYEYIFINEEKYNRKAEI